MIKCKQNIFTVNSWKNHYNSWNKNKLRFFNPYREFIKTHIYLNFGKI